MRWETIDTAPESKEQGALFSLDEIFQPRPTPSFQGINFHEVSAKSVLNKVPASSAMPFSWTINPYRGCSHACVYCFARNTHTYLDFDAGKDFDSEVVVKVNTVELLRKELAKPTWKHELVALGTNTDPYQRAEGRYTLMPGIIQALAESGTPFSILTKGTLLSRDLPLLKQAATQVPVSVGISLAHLDPKLGATLEPGTPSPAARLSLLSRLGEAGVSAHVMAMPILPWLSDHDSALFELFTALGKAGVSSVSTGALHLRPGARTWYYQWLDEHYPQLVPKYQRLYAKGSYAPTEYRQWLAGRVKAMKKASGYF